MEIIYSKIVIVEVWFSHLQAIQTPELLLQMQPRPPE